MAYRWEAADHEAQKQEAAGPIEDKVGPARFGACKACSDRKSEII
jgi:hypothetical protein